MSVIIKQYENLQKRVESIALFRATQILTAEHFKLNKTTERRIAILYNDERFF